MLRTVLHPLTRDISPIAVDSSPSRMGAYGAALFIARSPDPTAARAEVDLVLDALVDGLRARTNDQDA